MFQADRFWPNSFAVDSGAIGGAEIAYEDSPALPPEIRVAAAHVIGFDHNVGVAGPADDHTISADRMSFGT